MQNEKFFGIVLGLVGTAFLILYGKSIEMQPMQDSGIFWFWSTLFPMDFT
jgi:hypothetical protein